MASFIVCLANDGQFQRVTVEADEMEQVADDNLVFRDECGDLVASFTLWAWVSRKEFTRVARE